MHYRSLLIELAFVEMTLSLEHYPTRRAIPSCLPNKTILMNKQYMIIDVYCLYVGEWLSSLRQVLSFLSDCGMDINKPF